MAYKLPIRQGDLSFKLYEIIVVLISMDWQVLVFTELYRTYSYIEPNMMLVFESNWT